MSAVYLAELGRSKRDCKLLPAGVEALSGSKAVFDRVWEGLHV